MYTLKQRDQPTVQHYNQQEARGSKMRRLNRETNSKLSTLRLLASQIRRNSIPGCYTMTNEDQLHQETNILPIKEHSKLLPVQYSRKCFN